MKKAFFLLFLIISFVLLIGSCNNPFSTREPEKNTSEGAAIKSPKSPENVLYNLEAAFEGLSIQDYLDVFSDDFVFHPDPEDSLEYEQEFGNGWDYEKETMFANNFLQKKNFAVGIEDSPIDIFANYEFKPGLNMYEYRYNMFIIEGDSLRKDTQEIEGKAWLYLREDSEGKWAIYQWIDYRIRPSSITWGGLRAGNI